MHWPLLDYTSANALPRAAAFAGVLPAGEYRLDGMPLFCQIVPDGALGEWLTAHGRDWRPVHPIHDARGTRVGAVWRDADGSVLLPFDPAEAMRNLWSEAYHDAGASSVARSKRLGLRAYYRVRPLLPRAAQIRLRRWFTRIQARTRFPRWPVETSLHDLYAFLFQLVANVAGEPVPWLAPWPRGRTWALVLTHDVETDPGYRRMRLLRTVEERAGFRSSWNFVPKRYAVHDAVVHELTEAGFEVGVHGLYHDGRDLESLALLEERLPAMRASAERWGAVGFRAPATHRMWDWMPRLGFDYDSSYPDTDPFEPQAGGCCTWLPFFNRQTVELPITLAQDHTMFVIQGCRDGAAWLDKAEFLRARGGMALLITHPDYMVEAHHLAAYERLLQHAGRDQECWRVLPRDVSAWWRRRAASSIQPMGESWRAVGPAAAEAQIRYAAPDVSPALVTAA